MPYPIISPTPVRPHRSLLLTAGLLAFVLAPSAGWSQTGVDDDRVSLPDGPGSLEGVGDNVEIDPNMGTMQWSVPFEVSRGFSGLEPELGLSYSSGSGTGVVGIGWSMPMPTIERMTTRGVPTYTTSDRFAADGGEELVAVSTGSDRVYRARYEKGFVRYTWVGAGAGAGGYWKAEYPDGLTGYFGADALGNEVGEARSRHSDGGVYRYHLVDVVDPWGHRLHYTYDTFGGNRPLMTGAEWVFVNGQARYTAQLDYETRPDIISDCGAGYEEQLGHRLSRVRALSGAEIVREAVLEYEDGVRSGGASRLRSVQKYGTGGQAGGSLYPIAFSFAYSRGLGATCAANDPTCSRPYLVNMGTLGGAISLGSGNATLIDINGDGLPDVLDTTQNGPHRFSLNQLVPNGAGFDHTFAAPMDSAVATGSNFRLSSQNVQTLDINGDGYSDLIDTSTGSTLVNGGQGSDWAAPGSGVGIGALPLFTGGAFEQLRFIDYDNDKRIDVIQSSSAETRIYRNTGTTFEAELVEPLGVGFATSNLQLADMNGDGLSDPVEVLEGGSVRFRLNLGRGHWSAFQTIPGVNVPLGEQDFVDLEDLNGDGLDDIVVVVGTTIKYAINRNANSFDAFVTIGSGDIDGELPAREGGVTVLYADMNGNGSEDVVWFDTNGGVQYLELFPVRPNLLSEITNGIGMIQKVTYGTSVEHAARARAAGPPWDVELPNATAVVDQTDLYVTLTGGDDGSGVHEITNFTYRNGYYDGEEKQLRGFTHVVSVLRGDEFQEEGATRYVYDNGLADDYHNGLLLSQAVESDGRVLSASTFVYEDCPVAEVPGNLEPPVRHVCQTAAETVVQEGLAPAAWVTTRTQQTWDGYGNVTLSANLGVVARGGVACGAACEGDEQYLETEYVTPAGTNGLWLLGTPRRGQQYTDPNDPFKADVRFYYDGEPFEGLPEGQLTHGFLTRQTAAVSATDTVTQRRARHDDHGNVIESIDADGDPNEPNAHRRTSTWDDAGILLTRSDVFLTDSAGAAYQLRREYSYDPRFQAIVEATDHMVVRDGAVVSPRNSRRYAYDAFGRIASIVEAGDARATPSREFSYELGDPVSRVAFRSRSQSGGALDEVFYRCFDGKGRKVQDRVMIEQGRYQVLGFSVFNNRGSEVEKFQPYTSDSPDCDMAPPTSVASTRTRYDAIGRVRAIEAPDAGIFGTASVTTTDYEPLITIVSDPEDADPTSPHHDTPTLTGADGLGRVVFIDRLLRDTANALQTARTELAYDNLGNLAAVTDPDGNVRAQTFDRLGRPIAVHDPNTGTTALTYDTVGNVVGRTDARGVATTSVYDGANRRIARFQPSDRDATMSTWRFDVDPDCPAAECTNIAGRMASIRYPLGPDSPLEGTGAERMGYDVRGMPVFKARTLGDVDLVTRMTYDNRSRLVSTVHPDGTEVTTLYDRLSRATAMPGFIDAVTYDPRGVVARLDLANGARNTWTYDVLQRATNRTSLDGSGAIIESRDYTFDRGGNIVAISDGGPAVPGLANLSATLTTDAWYRPTTVSLSAGTDHAEVIEVRYGLVDQLLSRTSSLGAQSPAHVGDYAYLEERPLAASQAGSIGLGYDEAGNTLSRGAASLVWDFLGRLTAVTAPDAEPLVAIYGADQRRVLKRDAGSLVLYGSADFEVRDGVATTYVRFGGRRVARHEDASFGTTVYPDLAPVDAPDSAITAADAFVAFARGSGALPGEAPAMDPDLILAAAAARVLTEQEDATAWLHTDHLGSITAATAASGAVRGRRAYYPFGQLRQSQGTIDPHGFTGQERDTATGLDHFKFRTYDPTLGRWASADPAFSVLDGAAIGRLAEALGAYSYVANNPVNLMDPLGLRSKDENNTKVIKKVKNKQKKGKQVTPQGKIIHIDLNLANKFINTKKNLEPAGGGRAIVGSSGSNPNPAGGGTLVQGVTNSKTVTTAFSVGVGATVAALAGIVGVVIGLDALGGPPVDDTDDDPDGEDDVITIESFNSGPDESSTTPELEQLTVDNPTILTESTGANTQSDQGGDPNGGSSNPELLIRF